MKSFISLFPTAMAHEPDRAMTVENFMHCVKTGTWRDQVTTLRGHIETGDRQAYDAGKRHLPAVTLSCSCLSRERDLSPEAKAVEHSGWLQADFDLKDNLILADSVAVAELREALHADPYIGAVFQSPSGEGLKAVVRIDGTRHKESWFAAETHFRDVHGLTLDKSTKDPMRLCFVSYDPCALTSDEYTEIPIPAPAPAAPPRPTFQTSGDPTADEIADALQFVPPRPDYDTWLRIASAVWSVLPMAEGAALLNKWSPEEKEGEYALKHKARLANIGVATLFYIARNHGYRPKRPGRVKVASSGSPAIDADPLAYTVNDAGRAERFVDRFHDRVRYLCDREVWLVWDDDLGWTFDRDGQLERLAVELSREMLTEVGNIPGTDEKAAEQRKLAAREALACGDSRNIRDLLTLAKINSRIIVNSLKVDSDAWIVGCPNGLVDLREGVFRPFTREDIVTQRLAVDFDPDATCPNWERFIEQVLPDSEVRDFFHKSAGYALSGDTREQNFLFLYGIGGNGKSTVVELIEHVLGDYAVRAGQGLITQNPHGTYPLREVAGLFGRRLALGAECAEGQKLNEGLVKDLTGGDRLRGANLYENAFEFRPSAKLWIIGNHKPVIRGTDEGIWRRVRLIPFTQSFSGENADRSLPQKLRAEAAGILNWLIVGCLKWQEEGLTAPAAVMAAVEEYRSESDTLADFIADRTKEDMIESVSHGEVFESYRNWCERSGIRYQLSSRMLATRLRDRGWVSKRTDRVKTMWMGVCLETNP